MTVLKSAGAARSASFSSAVVSADRFLPPAGFFNSTDITAINKLTALTQCMSVSWCTVTCKLTETHYIISNMLVTGGTVDPMTGNKLDCYTTRPKGIFYHSPNINITATPGHGVNLVRVIENLSDGVYAYEVDECFYGLSAVGTEGFVLVDLKSEYKISYLKFVLQGIGQIQTMFFDIEIRVGNASTSLPYSSYALLGTYTGPTYTHNIELTITGVASIVGRYVALVKTTGRYLQICHMEIY